MNVLLLVGTVLGVGVLTLGATISLLMAAPVRAAVLGFLAGAWGALYAALVLAASLTSREQLLPPGETKYFCGFYLDCHIGVAVLSDSTTPAIGGLRASGTFHVLMLRFTSSAVRATLRPWNVQMHLESPRGTRYLRDRGAEAALGSTGALERDIAAGGAYTVRVVFDVPNDGVATRMMVEQGPALKFPEVLLIGDEGSLLHRKTWLALPHAESAIGMR